MTGTEKDSKPRAYGLTHGDMKVIRENQINRTVKMIPANNAENFQDKYFEEAYTGYEIAEHDAMHYHIALEARSFDPGTGTKFSKPRVKCIDVATFNSMMNQKPYNGFHGFVTHILHNPTLNKASKKVALKQEEKPESEGVFVASLGVSFANVKEAKEYYRTNTGKEPQRVWTLSKVVAELEKELTPKA